MDARAFIAAVRSRVDGRLGSYLQEKRDEAARLSPASLLLLDGVEALTMRGGKRLRPALAAAAHAAVAPDADPNDATDLGASLELLQSFLLIHDDWMDGDDERRGGPAVHAAFRARVGNAHLANSLAVLAGDLAGTYAWELFVGAPWPHGTRRSAERCFLRIHKEVFFGQHLDLTADPDVGRMHQLKTGSYTVRGPLLLGAMLAEADEAQQAALERAAEPLGEAFQLADDLLGTFGDPSVTGKPAGNDLRAGKHNAVVAAAHELLPEHEREPVDVVLGMGSEADDEQVERAVALLEGAGVRARVEERVAQRLAEADAALARAPLAEEGRALLRAMAEMLARRRA
ncbi:MAG: polyprenyl synthetase family protein [Myxococcota bacterium]